MASACSRTRRRTSIPNWDDAFEVGDVIAVEPAVYADDELKAGIRLENNYLVTESGVELLSEFELGL